MRNGRINKKTLDEIGKRLFESEATKADEIDTIVSNSRLFDAIKVRIAAEQMAASGVQNRPVHYFGRTSVILSGLSVFIIAVMAAVSLYRPETNLTAVNEVKIPDAVPGIARSVFPPQEIETGKLSADRALKADYRIESPPEPRKSTEVARRVRRSEIVEPEAEFYPVSYTDDPALTGVSGRIIRVDMKRSSLFALGINLPLENGDETIKADLLVGSDGVTRAIRVVNQ